MAKGRVLLHPGYPKTASTWLQKHVFPELGFQPWTPRQLNQRMVRTHPAMYDHEALRSELDASRRVHPWSIISSENLVSGSRDGPACLGLRDRLHDLAPDGHVLLVVREQVDMLVSWYGQSIRTGAQMKLGDFLEPYAHLEVESPHIGWLDYAWMVESYKARFGDRVTVAPFELLRRDPARFVQRIADLTGGEPPAASPTKENVRLGPVALKFVRHMNRVWHTGNPSHAGWLRAPGRDTVVKALSRGGKTNKLRARVASWAGDRYADSNQRLQKLVNDDLSDLGYRL